MPNIIQEHLKVIQHHLFHYIQIILEYDPTYYINDYIRTNYL
jgi:heat shock protein HspQ